MNYNIPAREKCHNCKKKFHIKNLEVCRKCKKILCQKCKLYLSRTSAEINFDYHYCTIYGSDPGEFIKVYNL
jgi:hypothetical protein